MGHELTGAILFFGGMFESIYCAINERMDDERRIMYLLHGICFMILGGFQLR